jgi:hypothetical protein
MQPHLHAFLTDHPLYPTYQDGVVLVQRALVAKEDQYQSEPALLPGAPTLYDSDVHASRHPWSPYQRQLTALVKVQVHQNTQMFVHMPVHLKANPQLQLQLQLQLQYKMASSVSQSIPKPLPSFASSSSRHAP